MGTTFCIADEIESPTCNLQDTCFRLEQSCLDALRFEANAWPKPGLVTPVDSGSHRDMNIATLLTSIEALRGSFVLLAEAGARGASFAALQEVGIAAEHKMLRATAGINTHRGAIFNLGMLVAAAARRQLDQSLHGSSCGEVVARLWGAEIAAARKQSPASHGNSVFEKYSVGGARTEAAMGFPSVYNIGLPVLRRNLAAGHDRESALIATLLALMEHLPDSNLLWRGGKPGLEFVQQSAAAFNRDGGVAMPGCRERLLALHRECVARNLSPGGSADLMAASWVAYQLDLNPDCSLDINPSQPPLDWGGADCALPLSRGSWRGFGSNEKSGITFTAG